MSVCVPSDSEVLRQGYAVWSGAFTHAVQFVHRDVQAVEELQRVPGDGRGTGKAEGAAVHSQRLPHFLVHQTLGQAIVQRLVGRLTVPEMETKN